MGIVKDGRQFPALQEIINLQSLPDPNRVFQDLARAQAWVKVDEVSKLMADLEAACANLAALVMTLGEGLNSEEDIKSVVTEIEENEEVYVKKAREALRALAEASGKGQTVAPAPLPPAPRPESNKFSKISATAEPSSLPRDVTPNDFQLWLIKFETFSNASWIPGPPTSGEKLRQLRVYLGTPWQDVVEHINLETSTYDEVIKLLSEEIAIHYPIVRRRIELFSLPDQMSSEGPWEYWRRVVSKCKNGAIGSRETGLDLTYDQFVISLFLKGLRESDREKIQSKYMNYEASCSEIEEVAKSLEQSGVSLKAKSGKKGTINAISKNTNSQKPCTRCKRKGHTQANCTAKQCAYCKGYFRSPEQCWVNPQSSSFRGGDFAKEFWDKRKATAAATGGSASATPTPGVIAGIIAVATLRNGALIQCMPTPRIKARKTDSEDIITLLPDSGATLNTCCRASAEAWGLQIVELEEGEVSLTDVQGGQIPLVGKATIALTLPSRQLETSVSLVVADTLGLPELIIGWMDLQRWGILQLEEEEVSGGVDQGILAITSSAQRFLDSQTVYPPRTKQEEIDPCDLCYVEKMEVACSQLREQLLKEVPLAFADQLEPQNVVNFPPVRISVREDMTPVKVYSARPFPLGREQQCKQIIEDLIKRVPLPSSMESQNGFPLHFLFARGHQTVEWFVTSAVLFLPPTDTGFQDRPPKQYSTRCNIQPEY